MNAGREPSEADARRAVELLLPVIAAGEDLFAALGEIGALHPKDNTFPGEVFIRVAADALDEGRVGRHNPLVEEGLLDRYLPECHFKGRDNRKIRYAVLAVGATHGGVRVDLLEEVMYWAGDDFWRYAALAAVAWIRAVADQRDLAAGDLCARLSARGAP